MHFLIFSLFSFFPTHTLFSILCYSLLNSTACQTPALLFPSLFSCQPAYAILYPKNLLRYESCTYLIKFPWKYKSDALQNIISSAPSTPFATHTLATCLFPVSCDLSSSNDIGFHTIELLLTFNSWFSFLQRCNLNTYFH